MAIDLHAKSQELLEVLANSIHDREKKNIDPFCFSITEIHAAEKWLKQFIADIQTDCVCV